MSGSILINVNLDVAWLFHIHLTLLASLDNLSESNKYQTMRTTDRM